jgi:hypothetical protein
MTINNNTIATNPTASEISELCANALRAGLLDKQDVDRIAGVLDREVRIAERRQKAFVSACEQNREHAPMIADIVSAINKFVDLGVEVDTYKAYRLHLTCISTPKYMIEIDDSRNGLEWHAHSVRMPSAALTRAYNWVIEKYGLPLTRDIISVYNAGGKFWDEPSAIEVARRGWRLVETLKSHGWDPSMSEVQYQAWKGDLPEFWLECVVRAILSGATGRMTCLGCQHAIFNAHGYVRCTKCTHSVPIEYDRLASYIELAKETHVYGSTVTSDIVPNVNREECHLALRGTRRELTRLQKAYHKFGK